MILIKQQEKITLTVTSQYDNKDTVITFLGNLTIVDKRGVSREDRVSINLTSINPSVFVFSAEVLANIVTISINNYTISNQDTQDHTIDFILTNTAGIEFKILDNAEILAKGLLVYDGTTFTTFDKSFVSGDDVITDYISDLDGVDFYYWGYNRNGNWEIIRNKINVGRPGEDELATISNNSGNDTLDVAWANRVGLSYSQI